MNQIAIEQTAERAAPPWRVFRMNDYECWLARSKEEACQAYVDAQGCSLEDCEKYELLKRDDVVELTEAELDCLIFVDGEFSLNDPKRKRTFRAELQRLLRVDKPQFAQMFSTTEI